MCSSVALRPAGAELLPPWPADRPENWLDRLNQPEADSELDGLRTCVNPGWPFGSEVRVAQTAKLLGLESARRPHGRPRKAAAVTVPFPDCRGDPRLLSAEKRRIL